MNLLQRRSPFNFDSLFDHLWAPLRAAGEEDSSAFVPRVDVKERKNKYEITAELPGVEKSDVHVTLDDGLLTIEAESNREDTEEEDGRVIRQERHYGKFVRSFNVGSDVKESDIHASFKNAVLKLDVPHLKEAKHEVKKIAIK